MSQPSHSSSAKRSFAPVVDEHTRLVILGSLPGEASLSRGQYYANPRNQLWRLLEGVIGAELAAASYEDRLARLLGAGIGLWDVIETAERVGSLDTNIRAHQARALGDFAATLPALRALAFNGGKASEIGRRQFAAGEPQPALLTLPSSSPAHAIPFERKQAAWLALKTFL